MQIPARLQSILAILTGALFCCWPAFLNRYPLLYFGDSMYYFHDGRAIAAALFLHRLQGIYAGRSEIYSLGIFLAHWNLSAWPVVALQALLTSFVIFLVVRSIVPRRPSLYLYFLGIMAFLSVLTSMSWYVTTLMPDILGGPLYLSVYLLIFARATLSKMERWALALLVVWTTASHATHWMAMACLCAALALLLFLGWRPIQNGRRALVQVTAMLCLAVAALLALHLYFYRKLTISGNQPPFLMARIVVDGPGKWYLQAHCATLNWYVCTRAYDLPRDNDHFLWGADGVWSSASYADQQRLLAEQAPLVLATLRAYPGAEIGKAFANFARQLIRFSELPFEARPESVGALSLLIPGGVAGYTHSLQAREALPIRVFTRLQSATDLLCVVAVVGLLPLAWRRQQLRLISLAVVMAIALIANAFVSAVFSGPAYRYEERVIWLVPLLAALLAIDLFAPKRAEDSMPSLRS